MVATILYSLLHMFKEKLCHHPIPKSPWFGTAFRMSPSFLQGSGSKMLCAAFRLHSHGELGEMRQADILQGFCHPKLMRLDKHILLSGEEAWVGERKSPESSTKRCLSCRTNTPDSTLSFREMLSALEYPGLSFGSGALTGILNYSLWCHLARTQEHEWPGEMQHPEITFNENDV